MAKEKKMTAHQKKAMAEKQKKKEMWILTGVAAVIILAVVLIAVISLPADDLHADGATLETAEPTHYVTIEIENYGVLKGELYGNTAPISVANFVQLAESGFYSGLTFHRIIEGFMMQGGAPKTDSPKVSPIKGEFSENGIENNLLHEPGVLSMARTSEMDSATSQFFIMHEKYPSLDGKYAAFGRITQGLEIVDKICTEAEPVDGNGTIPSSAQPVIKSITVVAVSD